MPTSLFNPIALFLSVLCLQWVTVGAIGSFSVRLPYLLLGLVIVFAATGPRKTGACLDFVRANAAWIAPLAAYLVILLAILHGSPGASIAPRQLFFLVGAICFAGCLAAARRRSRILRTGAAAGMLFFLAASEVVARRIGLSWLDAAEAFLRGDLDFVVYDFFRAIFTEVDLSEADVVAASTKNEVAVSLLVLGLLFRAGAARPQRDVTGLLFMGGVLALLLMTNTRSVIIVAAFSVLLAMIVGAAVGTGGKTPVLILKLLAVGAIATVAVSPTFTQEPLAQTLGGRFTFEDASTADRVDQYVKSFDIIEEHPLTGIGYTEISGHRIHNLFLSSWVQAGIGAFLLVCVFYVCLLVTWLRFLSLSVSRPDYWVLPLALEWIAPLPILPLFRVWLSGDAGHLFLGEWIAIAAFLGCLLANRRRRSRIFDTPTAAAAPAVSRPAGRYPVGSA